MESLIQNIFISIFGQNPLLITFLLSMLPVIEIKGALPFGMSSVWDSPLSASTSLAICVLGGTVATGIFTIILSKIMPKIKKLNFYVNLQKKFHKKTATLATQNNEFKKLLFLCLFTLIPIPLTGFYTSCVIASLCDLKPFSSWCFINLGNLIAGVIIILLGFISQNILTILLYISFGVFILYGLYVFILLTTKLIKTSK